MVSVIIPVKNEEDSIGLLLKCLSHQSKKADEIVIVDGGSTDGTVAIVKGFQDKFACLKLICVEQAFPGKARNIAFINSSNNIVLSIDAGCIPNRKWIENILRSFDMNPSVDVVFGGWRPIAKTLLEKCFVVASISSEKYYSVACMGIKRDAWIKIQGFPEDMRTAEDLIFINKLKYNNCRIIREESAFIYWYHCAEIKTYYKKYYQYAVGKSSQHLDFKFYIRKMIFYLLLFILFVLSIVMSLYYFTILVVLFTLWIYLSIRNHYTYFKLIKNIPTTYFLMPVVIVLRDVATIIGFIKGSFVAKNRDGV